MIEHDYIKRNDPKPPESINQNALKHIEGKFPFEIVSLHSDNGGEILNHHVSAYLGSKAKQPFLWRSRPRHSNDNARVEENELE